MTKTEDHKIDVSKKLSNNLEIKINKLNAKWNKTKEEYKHDILDIYETAISEGYSQTNAAKLCREKIDIFSDRTIMRTLPESATRSYNKPNLTNVKIKNQTRLVVPEEPSIPPATQQFIEAEIISQREPPKAIDRPIAIPDRRIKLDTAKFRSDLRIALINGDKVWLKYNSQNEVIEITER